MSGILDISDAGYTIGVNVQITQRDAKTGRILATREGHNRCLRQQLMGITKWLNGEFNDTQSYLLHYDYIPRYLAVGTNLATMDSSGSVTTEVSVNDTRLLSELSPRMKLPERNKVINRSTQAYVQLVISTYLPKEYYNNQTICEAGLFSKASGNNCLFRIVFEGIPKTEDSVIEINWIISVISVDSQNQPYESVDKSGLRAIMQQILTKMAEVYPDFDTACADLDNPGISLYGSSSASQSAVDNATAILAVDYDNIKDLQPGSRIIPEGYVNTNNANATSSDLLSGKTAYVQGSKVTGSIPTKNSHSEFKDSTTDLHIRTITTDTSTRTYFSVDNVPALANSGDTVAVKSGTFSMPVNIPQDILAEFLGITPSVIREGVEILGITGTYRGGN